MINFPDFLKTVLEALEGAGYEGYCVGGCVRDLLMGREPSDWDVTTSALPDEVMALFGKNAIPTGLQHGTVTVLSKGRRVEVTTYRRDGAYLDHRRPEQVTFTASLEEDLSRRDFTVNAIAMDVRGHCIDPYGGREDLALEILQCVGEAERRFEEDALRIMRCLRFSATLGFVIEDHTARALFAQKELLKEIAVERICTELSKLLCGIYVEDVLMEYPEILGVFLPEILPAIGFDQRNHHHCFSVWEHIVRAVSEAEPNLVLRYTLLLHDLGKPDTFTLDEEGVGHFYSHGKRSEEMARTILNRLKMDHATRDTVCRLVKYHDAVILPTETSIRRWLMRLGEENLRLLLKVQRCDNLAQHPKYLTRQQEIDELEMLLEEVLRQEQCFSLRQLAVKGTDLMALGLTGREIGESLHQLLEQVVEGTLTNEKEQLLNTIKENRL